MTRTVTLGFIPLIDAAVPIAAAEIGFAAREGLDLRLVKEVSWANIRDRLAFRQFDVAHMLAPMTVASQLGIGSNPYPVVTPVALGRGGNAITLSTALFAAMEASGEDVSAGDAASHARALKRVVDARRADGRPPLVFAVVYPFSAHNYEFRFFMGSAGIDPDRDVRMTVVPPPLMADALMAGAVDGFCVNAPWNMLAVERGAGRIVAVKADIWPASPEKVLGMRPDLLDEDRDTACRLVVAMHAAARWCDDPANRSDLAAILARPDRMDVPGDVVRRLLDGEVTVDPAGTVRRIPDYLRFAEGAATFPWISQALWIYAQMLRWGQVAPSQEAQAAAARAFRPDVWREALAGSGVPIPAQDRRVEGALAAPAEIPTLSGGPLVLPPDRFGDDRPFDPDRIEDYVSGFSVRTSLRERQALAGE
ncbi:CmpA/NrtA family ABC transporter substrate-binding protein [Antarcticirhabdus aurantiaca]|uniref:CmpA/NrtA family ABC transporter substrate-binding protein n=1 Tax=Antarcticirhabdus aurantiaca TaxID=2606717 RepID=A0ACD4NT50_9HYPH|nr:CmpA/NrtA family ABC transporter substrate-binding protein [Antarcticirhabdus aurantiaca]WAJ30175.1 CmpA/NrtA family ABC transporter substrate-binding protein [Jeongeuplla avenae]